MSRVSGRRVRVIFNPSSGSKGGLPTNDGDEAAVREAMARAGLGAELHLSDSAAAAMRLTREAVAAGYDIVVAAGGDGTVGTVARELLGSDTALGILPLGSVMNIGRMLDLPRELDAAAEIIATGRVRAIDVGIAKGMVFFEGGSVGLNAAVFREAQQVDAGHYASLFAGIWTLLRYRPSRMIIHLDDRVLTTRALAVTVANGPYTGLGFTVAPDALLDDGRFDVCVFARFSRTELIRHFRSIAFGRRQFSPKVRSYRSARVQIKGVRPLPCRADAEDLGTTPVTYLVKPAALKVIVPATGEQTAPAPEDGTGGTNGDDDGESSPVQRVVIGVAVAIALIAAGITLRSRRHSRPSRVDRFHIGAPRWLRAGINSALSFTKSLQD